MKAIVLTHKQVTLRVPLLPVSRLLPTWPLNLTVSVKISFYQCVSTFCCILLCKHPEMLWLKESVNAINDWKAFKYK